MAVITRVTDTDARYLPISRTLLPIGRGNIWKAVRFSISLDIAGEPKNTAAKTGRSERTNAQI